MTCLHGAWGQSVPRQGPHSADEDRRRADADWNCSLLFLRVCQHWLARRSRPRAGGIRHFRRHRHWPTGSVVATHGLRLVFGDPEIGGRVCWGGLKCSTRRRPLFLQPNEKTHDPREFETPRPPKNLWTLGGGCRRISRGIQRYQNQGRGRQAQIHYSRNHGGCWLVRVRISCSFVIS